MVVDVFDGDVQPHVGRLLPVVRSHKEGVFGPPLPVQLPGGDQVAGLGVDAEAVVRPAQDGVGDQSVRTLRWENNKSTMKVSFKVSANYVRCTELMLSQRSLIFTVIIKTLTSFIK